MKLPKYMMTTSQEVLNSGLNTFALTLLAESFADRPEVFSNENIILAARAHNKQVVWFIVSKEQPKVSDFNPPGLVIDDLCLLFEDATRHLHNDFEPDNQSALYERLKKRYAEIKGILQAPAPEPTPRKLVQPTVYDFLKGLEAAIPPPVGHHSITYGSYGYEKSWEDKLVLSMRCRSADGQDYQHPLFLDLRDLDRPAEEVYKEIKKIITEPNEFNSKPR